MDRFPRSTTGRMASRMLKELSRSYLTISKDLGRVMNRLKALYRSWAIPCAGTQVYAPRYPFGMVQQDHGSRRAPAGGTLSTNNSTRCGFCANKPGKSCWPRVGNTAQRSCYARFLGLVLLFAKISAEARN